LNCWGGIFDWDNALLRLEELNAITEDPKLWDDAANARKICQEKTRLDDAINEYKNLSQELADAIELIELAELENDEELIAEALSSMSDIKERARVKELEALLSGELDSNDAYLEVHSGSGGTEACDWAEMLLRMYVRWAEKKSHKIEYAEETAGDVAGIKSVTIKISGHNVYGWLKAEAGVHRLVRISPFDSSARRHTSFASIGVYPVIDDDIEIDINQSDCRVDTYRASGAGGQHINKTDSAVRITHLPTGIVVQCQSQRSQLKNRDAAWKMLKSRLYELEIQKREADAQSMRDAKTDIGWGHQIRSYVLHPYQMIKDLRSNVEKTDSKAVLDGDLDDFLSASLALKVSKDESES